MKRVPQQRPRRVTLRFTGPDGVTYQGDGYGFAVAVRNLVRHRPNSPATAGPAVQRPPGTPR